MSRFNPAVWLAIAAPFALVFLVAAQEDSAGGGFFAELSNGETSFEPNPGKAFVYTVQPGDTLHGIAGMFGLKAGDIRATNSLANEDVIPSGTQLAIPLVRGTFQPSEIRLLAQAGMLREVEQEFGLPHGLFLALAWQESHWRQSAISHKGAVGIGQLMPSTAVWIEEELLGVSLDWEGSTRDNARAAAAYLAYLLEQSNDDVWIALASYYQGAYSFRTSGPGPTTPAYVRGVLTLLPQFQ